MWSTSTIKPSDVSLKVPLKPNTFVVFGFDGVLAVPWEEKHFNDIPSILKILANSGKYYLGVVSFNPRAIRLIQLWNLCSYFTLTRIGMWLPPFLSCSITKTSKYQQIISMVHEIECTTNASIQNIIYFESDHLEIENVATDVSSVLNTTTTTTTGEVGRCWNLQYVCPENGFEKKTMKLIQRKALRSYHQCLRVHSNNTDAVNCCSGKSELK